MTKGVWTVENWRRLGTKSAQRPCTGEEIPNEPLTARNQLVRQNVPGPRLQTTSLQRCSEFAGALRPNVEVVVQHDGLAVEKKTARRYVIVEEFINERHQALPKTAGGVVPLTVPVRVRDNVD